MKKERKDIFKDYWSKEISDCPDFYVDSDYVGFDVDGYKTYIIDTVGSMAESKSEKVKKERDKKIDIIVG